MPLVPVSADSLSSSSEGSVVNANVSMPPRFRGEEVVEFPQEDLPVKFSQVPNPLGGVNLPSNFPARMFEPALLLTPPRQKSNSEFSPMQEGKQASSKGNWQLFFMLYICNVLCLWLPDKQFKKILITIQNL